MTALVYGSWHNGCWPEKSVVLPDFVVGGGAAERWRCGAPQTPLARSDGAC